jgi:hypothetical protein
MISHRLFVAAVGTETTSAEEPERKEPAIAGAVPQAPAIPLEVLESSRPMPSGVLRRLQSSTFATR